MRYIALLIALVALAGCGTSTDCTRTVTGDAEAMRQAASDIAACERAAREAEAAAERARAEAAARAAQAAQAATAAAYVPPTAIVPPTAAPTATPTPTPEPTKAPEPTARVIVPTVVLYVTVNAPTAERVAQATPQAETGETFGFWQRAAILLGVLVALVVVVLIVWRVFLAPRERTEPNGPAN